MRISAAPRPEPTHHAPCVLADKRIAASSRTPYGRVVTAPWSHRRSDAEGLLNPSGRQPAALIHTPIRSQGAFKYLQEIWRKKQSDTVRFLLRVRCWEYRQLPVIHRASRPSRPEKARNLGYKSKQGFVIYRVRVRRGSRKKQLSKVCSSTYHPPCARPQPMHVAVSVHRPAHPPTRPVTH